MANVDQVCEFATCPYTNLPKGHTLGDHPFPHPEIDDQPNQGIYPKYVVFKHPKVEITGVMGLAQLPDDDGVRHMELVDDFCFVLKPIKDKHARVAMAAYAESVKEEKPKLAEDLYEILGDY